MNIIQITDLHIGSLTDTTNEVDTMNNFKMVLESIMTSEKPDLVVLTGDLCFKDPAVDVYQYVIQKLEETGYNYKIISGNHDNTSMHSGLWTGKISEELYYSDSGMVFLDTAPGSMSDLQWAWLENECLQSDSSVITIFMHHPPAHGLVPHMDLKYAFTQISEFEQLLAKFPEKRFDVFCGHYHVERSLIRQNLHVFITPSCFVQISDETEAFKPDHYIPAYRRIIYDDWGNLTTTVRYLWPK